MKARDQGHYLRTLDGWRAIAILAVIFDHDVYHRGTGWLYRYSAPGVDVFFAISGILICSRLLSEERKTGTISLYGFYVRRTLRILPPACVYLAAVYLLGAAGMIPNSWRDVVSGLFFLRNYPTLLGASSWYTAHFWSLALEEQFYWLLPVVLVVTPSRWRWIALFTVSASIAYHRVIVLQTHSWRQTGYHADIRLDSLFVPALFAVIAFEPRGRDAFKLILKPWPIYAAAVVALMPFGIDTAWRDSVIVWLMPCVVLGSVLNPDNVFGRFLELPLLKGIGLISYSLYLWQQLFFVTHFNQSRPLGYFQSWPLCAIATLGLATASYWFIEKPSISLGRKILDRHRKSSASELSTAHLEKAK